MSYHGWYSKEDVLKDLRRVGQRGRLGRALDEGHVIVGEQPPPKAVYIMPDEETDLHLRSLCGGQLPHTHDRVVQPDLAGIARMLRMIDGPDDEPPEEVKEEQRKEQTTNRLVVISKLNPNSKEFIPSFNVTNKTAVKEEPKKTDECVPMTLNNDRTDTNKIPEKEKVALEKKMRDQDLRKKIIDTSNTICPKVTKDRNVAIVSLLKLHSQDPVGLNSEGNDDITGKQKEVCPNVKGDCNDATMTVPILKTPAYYEKCPVRKCLEEFLPPKCTKANLASIPSAAPIKNDVTEAKNLETDANIEESVNKVEKWLQDTTNSNKNQINEQKTKVDEIKIVLAQEDRKITTPKKPKIHLGPITFKRKNSKPVSPSSTLNSDVTENQNPKKEKCDEYKPSAYAEQLARKYAEHCNKLKANQENILTWKILTEIKAKEEKTMREKALADERAHSQEQADEASNTCVAL